MPQTVRVRSFAAITESRKRD